MTSPIVNQISADPGDVVIIGPTGYIEVHQHLDGTRCCAAANFEIVRVRDQTPAQREAVARSWEQYTEYGLLPRTDMPLMVQARQRKTYSLLLPAADAPEGPTRAAPPPVELEPEPFLLRHRAALVCAWVAAIAYAAGGLT